jgi:hypothetical protein
VTFPARLSGWAIKRRHRCDLAFNGIAFVATDGRGSQTKNTDLNTDLSETVNTAKPYQCLSIGKTALYCIDRPQVSIQITVALAAMFTYFIKLAKWTSKEHIQTLQEKLPKEHIQTLHEKLCGLTGDRRLSVKLVPTFVDRLCHVVSVTDPYGLILGFLDQSRYFFFQVAPQLYSRGWVDPVPDPLLLRKSGSAGNRTRTSAFVTRNSDR